MSEIRRYVVVDANDTEADVEHETLEGAQIAGLFALGGTYAVIERTYEYADSELVWTSTDDDTWPPEEEPVIECEIKHCSKQAYWNVDNILTDKEFKMCSEHMNGYNRDPMVAEELS
jgi:hypothetical protein